MTMGTNELIGTDPAQVKPAGSVVEGRWKTGSVPPLWDGRTGERTSSTSRCCWAALARVVTRRSGARPLLEPLDEAAQPGVQRCRRLEAHALAQLAHVGAGHVTSPGCIGSICGTGSMPNCAASVSELQHGHQWLPMLKISCAGAPGAVRSTRAAPRPRRCRRCR